MKTYLVYGFVMALGGALLSLVLHLLGYHSDASKLGAAQWIGLVVGLTISVTCIVLGVKARRAEISPAEEFGYGRAFGAGLMIVLFSALFGIVTNYIYFQVINPNFTDLAVQAQIEKMEARGMSGAQLEGAESMIRKMMSPAIQAVFGFVMAIFMGTIISLIVAAFVKRSASDQPPLVV
jgi:hypothetical protein